MWQTRPDINCLLYDGLLKLTEENECMDPPGIKLSLRRLLAGKSQTSLDCESLYSKLGTLE